MSPAPEHRRRRRRTAYKRRLRRQRLAVAAGVVGGVLTLGLLLLTVEAIAARNALETATSALTDARDALGAGELDRANDRMRSARVATDRAIARTTGPHWWAVSELPAVGDTPRMARSIVTLVDAAVELGEAGVGLAGEVLGDGAGLPIQAAGGRIDLGPLRATAADLAALPVDDLAVAAEMLAAERDRYALPMVRNARRQGLAAADDVFTTLDRAQLAAEVIPPLLGADGPRRYLLLVQNPGELRGTGGLIGFLGVLEATDGGVSLDTPEGVDPTALVDDTAIAIRGRFDGLIGAAVDQPVPFAARYDHIAAGSFLPSTNADPDLPTVAPVALAIYEQVTGRQLDGVIALDPVGLQHIYRAIGPLNVPAEAAELSSRLPDPIPPERIARVLLIDAYEALGGPTDERRLYQTAVAEAALRDFLAASWDGAAVARGLGDALAGRHLQVVTTDPDEQAALRELGVAGEFRPVRAGDDLLAVTAVNSAGTKSDVHVAHRISADIALTAPRHRGDGAVIDRRSTTRVEVDNGIDLDSDVYITRSLRTQRLGDVRETDERPGLVRTWFSVWLPEASTIGSVRTTDGFPAAFGTDELHGRRVVDHLLETPHDTTTGVEVTSDSTVPVAWDGRRLDYHLTVWRQGKAIPDHLDVAVTPPPGWRVVATRVEGGGAPVGLGPAGTGEPVAATRADDRVHLTGAATSDVRLRVTMEPT